VNNFLKILLIFIFITNCSLHKNSKFWSEKKIIKEKQENIKRLLKNEENLSSEFNPNLKISLYSKVIDKSFLNNFDNNNGRIDFIGDLKNISKYKFKKIKNFHQYDPKILFYKNDIIFFDNEGSILRFNNDKNLVWKKNIYTKSEKKQNPILLFANNNKMLLIADNISKYYALDINTGELLWSKNNVAPFNSQLKVYKDKLFVIDFENTLRAYSINNGNEIWNIKTQNSLIRSQKKLSMVIVDKIIYFNNYLGDISAVEIQSGEMLWQTPTQSSQDYDGNFLLRTSDIIADKDTLYFSNNKNQFFSLDIQTGTLNWQQKINSTLRPTLIDDYIFTVSLEGYLIIIEKNSGNIIRINNIFNNLKKENWFSSDGPKTCAAGLFSIKRVPCDKKKQIEKNKFKPTGFIVANNHIYLTTDHGSLLVINALNGKVESVIKIDNDKIARPSVLNQNLFITTDNSIIKLN
jgi:outer membrane protein assembly factor BamB